MQLENKTHNKKVEQIKRVLLDLNLPILPLNTVRSEFYTPDIVTRVNTKFVPMDFINSKERVTFDIGGLVLCGGKDICDFALAIIDDKLWDENLHDFRKVKLNLPARLTVIPAKEVKEFFTKLA
jgi:hypothetical protein